MLLNMIILYYIDSCFYDQFAFNNAESEIYVLLNQTDMK